MNFTDIFQVLKDFPIFFVSLGFLVGYLSGVLGVGGGWLITPALSILGFPIPIAVGTSLTQMIGTSFGGIVKHFKNGNVNLKLGIAFGLPLLLGVQLGGHIMVLLEKSGQADTKVGWIYAFTLIGMGLYMIWREKNLNSLEQEIKPAAWLAHPFCSKGPSLKDPRLPTPIPLWFIVFIGIIIGLFAGLLGLGGGFFLVPILVYILGVPTKNAVGTSLIVVFIGSIYGSSYYLTHDHVRLDIAGFLVLGSITGSVVGAAATSYINVKIIRKLFSGLVILAGISMAVKTLGASLSGALLLFGAATLVFLSAVLSHVSGKFRTLNHT